MKLATCITNTPYRHWRLNDDFDIDQRRRHLTRNIRIGVCMCACRYVCMYFISEISNNEVDKTDRNRIELL